MEFLILFLTWTIFKVFTEFITILLLFYVLVFWLRGLWDLQSPTRDGTHAPCIGWPSLNHWATREVPGIFFFFKSNSQKQRVEVIARERGEGNRERLIKGYKCSAV